MNVETGTEAAQFAEKEYVNGIFLASGPGVVQGWLDDSCTKTA
jgi:hypothetical protein